MSENVTKALDSLRQFQQVLTILHRKDDAAMLDQPIRLLTDQREAQEPTAEQIAARVLYDMTGTDPADGTPIGDLAASLDTGQVNAEDIRAALVDAVRIARGEVIDRRGES